MTGAAGLVLACYGEDAPSIRDSVGRVERSEAHQARQYESPQPVGLAALDPPYSD
jgi:hypothetical protein